MSSATSVKGSVAAGALSLLLSATGCSENPYQALKDERVGLGAVDPVTFPADNLGADGNRMQPGSGSFLEIPAFAGGEAIGYFAYPVNTMAGRDPLRVLDDNKPYVPVPTPTAYAFDATDAVPVPAKNKCRPPAGHEKWDPRKDPAKDWYLMQGNVFTELPKATYMPGVASSTSYVPVVAEARVSSSGHECQDIKSEKRLADLMGGKLPKRTGKYLAWLIIDPAAAVYPIDDPMMEKGGIGTQRWGWYNRYLLAYIDGGYIPTPDVMVPAPTMADPMAMKTVKRMVPQKLYVPLTVLDAMTMKAVDGEIGQGYDVLSAKRGAEGYSPICEVLTYDTTDPMTMLPLAPEALPKNAAMIEDPMTFGPSIKPASPHYIYCLQVQR